MSYSIQNVDATDQYTALTSLKTILDGLDVDYFDNTVLTVDREASPVINELEIKKGTRTIIKISMTGSVSSSTGSKMILYALEASAEYSVSSPSTGAGIRVITTNNSVAILWSTNTRGLLFSKTNTNKNSIICLGYGGTGIYAGITYEDNTIVSNSSYENKVASLTQILPLLLNSHEGEYLPHIYYGVRVQSASNQVFKQVTLNNRTFLTNNEVFFEL